MTYYLTSDFQVMNSHESLGLKEVSEKSLLEQNFSNWFNHHYTEFLLYNFHKCHSSSTILKVRARNLRKKEASKKQIETQKALATAIAPAAVKCEDENQVADVTTGFATPGAPIINAQNSISPGVSSNAVVKKKVYSVKIEDNIGSSEVVSR